MTDNLALYNRYAQPPQDALKAFNNGKFSGTDINPMWRIKALTEAFGPCGLGWYTEVKRMWREDTPDGAATVYCEVLLYVKYDGEWSRPIAGVGGNTLTRVTRNGSSTTDEAYKMAYTDALGIACKALGFGADIWWKSNDTKYTAYQEPESKPVQVVVTPTVPAAYNYKPVLDAFLVNHGLTMEQFSVMRKRLIESGAMESKPSSAMGEADWNKLFGAILSNFLDGPGDYYDPHAMQEVG